jgi:hypothetical protein
MSKNLPDSALRRRMLQLAAMSPFAGMSSLALAQQFPTAKVNTTKLAITDTEITVGQLHSATGTMAISETGNRFDPGRAARHRPDQCHGRHPGPQDQGHQGRRCLRLAHVR